MNGGGGPCGDAGMAGSSVRWCIAEVVIHAGKTVFKEALEAPGLEAIEVPRQVVRTHLIDGDRDNEFGWLALFGRGLWGLTKAGLSDRGQENSQSDPEGDARHGQEV